MDLAKLLRAEWDRSAAVIATVVGAIFLLVGWIGVSGQSYVASQMPYIISGGVGGLFFLAVGGTLWLSADLRDEWRKLDAIDAALRDGSLRWVEPTSTVEAPLREGVGVR
jgi:protein-S-isoprenylcysteine O-methyltransferase Ste14